MLALRSLRDVLQNVSLNLHSIAVVAMVRDLDQSVQVVIRSRWVSRAISAAPRSPIYMLLPCHTAVLRRNCQAKGVSTLGLLILVCASDIPSNRCLPDLLLQKLLVLFVLLGVLLEELA